MYQLLARIGTHDLAVRQLPAFAASFLIASLFYHFGSFALECVAFLATWYVIDAGIQVVIARLIPRMAVQTSGSRERS